jgi:hypothetical protein
VFWFLVSWNFWRRLHIFKLFLSHCFVWFTHTIWLFYLLFGVLPWKLSSWSYLDGVAIDELRMLNDIHGHFRRFSGVLFDRWKGFMQALPLISQILLRLFFKWISLSNLDVQKLALLLICALLKTVNRGSQILKPLLFLLFRLLFHLW